MRPEGAEETTCARFMFREISTEQSSLRSHARKAARVATHSRKAARVPRYQSADAREEAEVMHTRSEEKVGTRE